MRKHGFLMLALCAGACVRGQGPPDAVCTMEARSSFAVALRDSVSGARITSGATVRVTDGTFSEVLTPPPAGDSLYSGVVYERPGTYSVSVTHSSYQPWEQRGVQVTRDQCHVITQRVTARLRPADQGKQ